MTLSIHPTAKVHSTAIVEENVSIGANTSIWHWVHICSGAVIGDRCSFGQNVFISSDVQIGNNVKIQNNVSVYDRVRLDDNVFCGPSMVFTNVYNPRSEVIRKDQYRVTHVEAGATLGANCTIICGISIGRYAFIGAGAVVNSLVKPYALMVGVPARHIGWMSAYGDRINLPLAGSGKWICPHTQDVYELNGDQISHNPAPAL